MLGLERLGATQVKTLAWLKYGEVPLGWCTHQTLLIFTNCDFITVVILLLLLLSKWGETLTSINKDILVLSSMSYLLLANANNRITESFLLCCSRINTAMETDIGPPQFHLRPCLGHHFSLWQYFVKPTRDCSMYIYSAGIQILKITFWLENEEIWKRLLTHFGLIGKLLLVRNCLMQLFRSSEVSIIYSFCPRKPCSYVIDFKRPAIQSGVRCL